MKENKEIQILDKLYQVSEMGVIGIRDVIGKSENEELEKLLEDEEKEYNTYLPKVQEVYKKYGRDEKEISKMAKMSSEMMSKMKLMKGNKTAIIAKMMVQGNTTGILEIQKLQNEYQGEDEEIKHLMKELLELMEHNLEDVKKYL